MNRRLVIITEIISPYRIPLFNALAIQGDVDLHVIFLAETDPQLRQWHVHKEDIRFSYEVLPSWRRRIAGFSLLLNLGVARVLNRVLPDAVLCGGYNYIASWQALAWARAHKIPFVLWSESNLRDMRHGRVLVEKLKHEFLHRCSAFVVPGQSALEYLLFQKISPQSIFTAVNAVDNEFYCRAAESARGRASQLRSDLGLPSRYFLFVGRLVKEKGVFDLLSAYAKLDEPARQQMGLVFVGDGESRQILEQQSATISPGKIRFIGFAQKERLPAYYALADVLILPTHTDTWGLVVNEAMACGLPVILSKAAGCSADLVTEGWNGVLVEPRDISALSLAMKSFADQEELSKAMGVKSRERIAGYSPQEWSTGIVRMIESFRGFSE